MRGFRPVALSAALSVVFVASPVSRAMAHVKPGQAVPHYSISTFDKQKVMSEDLKGQVVIINFWATWCGPCKRELPELDAYYRKHAKDGLRVFAVTTEGSLPDTQLKPLQAAVAFPLAHRITGSGLGTMEGVPTNYVIDRQGVVRYAKAAAFDAEDLDAVIGPLLAEPADAPPAISVAASATR